MSVRSAQPPYSVSVQGGAPPFSSGDTRRQDAAPLGPLDSKPENLGIDADLLARRTRTARRRRLTIYGLRLAFTVIWLGLSVWGKASTAVVLVFFVVFFNAFQGVREVDRNLIANARILGADNRRLTTEIIIPSAMSWILASLHISFGLAIVGAVVGELFGATAGLGQLLYNARHTSDLNW